MRCPRLYNIPPQNAVDLEAFEELAIERLHILNRASKFNVVSSIEGRGERLEFGLLEDEVNDTVSHFALRLAFCRSQDVAWYIMAESKLFAWRLGLSQTNEVFKILSLQGLKYDAWNEEETKSFKVRFEEVPCLVSYRKTVICGGFCKVSMQDMAYVVLHHFEQQLHKYLRLLARTIPFIWQEFIRIEPIVIRIMRRYKNISQVIHKNMNSCVTPSEIDSIYKERFPLCMQYLHEKLRENHHLKYEGRVQYRMFLKGIGFTVEQNILFWQQEFTKSMSVQKFEKEYLYNIRHSYGLEGARKDYEPLTCSQILTNAAPRVGQYHGCPFKHWDPETLRHFLCKRGHSTVNANEIAHFSRQAKPQLACQKYFEFLHPLKDSKHIGEHPNAWFHSVQE